MELQVGVKIAIIRQGKILLLRRADGKYGDLKVGRWDIAGGRINAGTALLENLKREVAEETKMEIVGRPKLLAAQDILKSPDRHIVRLTYMGKAKGSPVLSQEHDEYKWVSLAALTDMGENLDVFIKELLDNKSLVF